MDRPGLLARLEHAWARSDFLFSLLQPEALYQRPIALRQPFIFYTGHLAAFAWNQVWRGLLGRPGFQPEYDELFARGIDPVGVDHYEPDRAEQWPSPSEVLAYRNRIRDALRGTFADVEALAAGDPLADQGRVYQLVIEHELMHHETLLYMMAQLDRTLLRRPAGIPDYVTGRAAPAGRARIPGGTVRLGAAWDAIPFGWDNEFPAHEVPVGDFTIDTTSVRNSEWLEFMSEGGYQRPELWSAEGWAWRERTGHEHPVFWKDGAGGQGGRGAGKDGGWRVMTLFDELPLEQVQTWPVSVSWAEADAFARWRGGALPTEAEFHRAAEGVRWGDPSDGNFDFHQWAPVPVGSMPGVSEHGVRDLVGNGWEWTATRFGPFPGFTPWARTYPGYSADFFDESHFVMLGASWATDKTLVRRSFRNWFQPHYPYVFAKFRVVTGG